MKRSSIVVALAAVLATLVATTAAFAGGSRDNVLYRYVGQVQNDGTLTVAVQNGNRAALRSLLDQGQVQTFASDEKTVFTKWTPGKPTPIALGDLKKNDYVTVNVRSGRNADIETITKKPAASVGDRGQTVTKPTKPLYLFRGTLVSAGAGKVTIEVKGGNRNALKLMIGQPRPADVHDQHGHRVPALGTPRTDDQRPRQLEAGRPDHDPDPCRPRLDARAGRGDAREARRRPRAEEPRGTPEQPVVTGRKRDRGFRLRPGALSFMGAITLAPCTATRCD